MEGGHKEELPKKEHVFLPGKLRQEQATQGLCLNVGEVYLPGECRQSKVKEGLIIGGPVPTTHA